MYFKTVKEFFRNLVISLVIVILMAMINHLFPDTRHISTIDTKSKEDIKIWEYAKQNNYVILTKDEDFNDLSFLKGFPPFVIWLNIGNCSTNTIEKIIIENNKYITDMINLSQTGVIEIS